MSRRRLPDLKRAGEEQVANTVEGYANTFYAAFSAAISVVSITTSASVGIS